MLKKVAFTVYPVFDSERVKIFYEKVLSLELSKISSNGAWVEYDFYPQVGFALINMLKDISPSSNSGGNVAFEVDDLFQIVKNLKKKGVEFKHDLFSTSVCRIAIIKDSEGNAVILHQLKRNKD